jgi:hypothetical protein
MTRGAIAFTLIFRLPPSCAADFESPMTLHLLAEYGELNGVLDYPETLLALTMDPPFVK